MSQVREKDFASPMRVERLDGTTFWDEGGGRVPLWGGLIHFKVSAPHQGTFSAPFDQPGATFFVATIGGDVLHGVSSETLLI